MSPEQKAIVEEKSKKILVKAGAGTGKTRVMIERVLHLLEEDPTLNINDFAIITFTNKATDEIHGRIKESLYKKWYMSDDINKRERFRLQVDLLNQSDINTIHKFCHTILNSIGPYFDNSIMYSPEFRIGSPNLTELYNYSIEKWLENKKKSNETIKSIEYKYFYDFKDIIVGLYKEIRNKGLSFDEVKDKTKLNRLLDDSSSVRLYNTEILEILELMFNYRKIYKYNKIDMDDLLEYTAHILKTDKQLRKLIKKRYKHIFVDEFQDTSLFQSEIIQLLCDGKEDSPSLFVVGDVKQSIYQFRGADLSSYQRMENWIEKDSQGRIMKLTTNWRSKPELVYFVNDVFKRISTNNEFKFKNEELKPSVHKEKIRLTDAYEWIKPINNEKHEEVVAKFLSEVDPKKLGDYAVLTRYNYQIVQLAKELKRYNIEVALDETGDFYKQLEITEIYKVLKSFIEQDNMILKNEAINSMFFRGKEQLYTKVFDDISERQLIYYYTPTQVLNYIYSQVNIIETLSTQQVANLNKLKEKIRETFQQERVTFKEFLSWLKLMIVSNQEERLADVPSNASGQKIQVMTIHKAKGLEYPYIILPYLDSQFSKKSLEPEYLIHPKKLSIEFCIKKRDSNNYIKSKLFDEALELVQGDVYSEELRVLYVALTRAKKKLYFIGDRQKRTSHESFLNWLIEE